MNWVLVFAGLLPLWAALFIVFSNMKVLREDETVLEAPQINTVKPVELDIPLETVEPEEEKPKSLFKGLLSRFKRDKDPVEEEIDFSESKNEDETGSFGLPRGIKRLWGVTFVLIFVACMAYGFDRGLEYVFREYRWVIGTTNPWTAQMQFANVLTSAIAGVSVMIATLRTGIFLLKG